MPRPDAQVLHDHHETSVEAQNYVDQHVEELIRRSRFRVRDGYPGASMGAGSGSSDIANPTAQVAIADPAPDPTGDTIREIIENHEEIWKLSQRNANLCAKVMAPELVKLQRVNEAPVCVNPNCGRSLVNEGPSGRGWAGRCRPCYDYRANHMNQQDRPLELVEKQRLREQRKLRDVVV